ncbi:MAG: hypothetical protein BWK76_08820 [Desulfobulbaceae bacterium A2]|nr:MAG: hypothetical protein BWK76_08820 [Desulfobulbaceae bacterium A2]
MSETIDELTVNDEVDGVLQTKELAKEILTRGAWTTILYRYQQLDQASGNFGPEQFTLHRYQKRQGSYKLRSKFNISNREQAQKIATILTNWLQVT